MNDKIALLKEKIAFFSYGDGITYTQMSEIINEFSDEKIKNILLSNLDNLFFCDYKEFSQKTEELLTIIENIESGRIDKDAVIKKSRKQIDDIPLVSDFIVESREGLAEFESKLLILENSRDLDYINDIFRIVHTIKGSTGFLELEELNEFSHINENLLDDMRNGELNISSGCIDYLFSVLDIYKENFDLLSESLTEGFLPEFDIDIENTKTQVENIRNLSKKKTSKKVKEVKDEEVADEIEEESIEEIDENNSSLELQEDEELIEQIEIENNDPDDVDEDNSYVNVQSPVKTEKVSKAIKVDVDKVDFMLDNVGELIVVNNMLFEDSNILKIIDKKTTNTLSQLKRVSSRLQNSAMSLRMVPIDNTFQKMRRIVRDNSKKLNKTIKLILRGESTEIDRNMVDKLYDPLMHMIRNSCDHGLENQEERKISGKDTTGTITLSAYHKGGNIVIEIKDDGKGLSKDKIIAKAISNGLITENDHLSDHEIYNLIFKPGFSTAEKVTSISGRGVGMDVVKNNIESLGGKVDIESEEGIGSTFYIKLPLTLAILDGVVIRIGNEKYILPAQVVEEGIDPKRNSIVNMANRGEVIKIRENVYPIVRLNNYFCVDSDAETLNDGIMVLVDTEREKIALHADEILGKQEVVIKNLGEFFVDYDFISGSAIMGDGSVSLIVDVNKLS